MKKLNLILKLSFEFSAKYAYGYIKNILKYILIGMIGLIFLPLSLYNPIFALFALFITIPSFCYAFWKGYLITYALNYAALEYITKKKQSKDFTEYIELTKKQENELIKFVSFMAIVITIGYIPSVLYFANNISTEKLLIDPSSALADMKDTILCFTINTVILAQFINFALQAFFFRRKESYFGLLINCYKNTGVMGFIISNIIIGITTLLSCKAIITYLIVFLPLNLIIYSINLFLYLQGIKKE